MESPENNERRSGLSRRTALGLLAGVTAGVSCGLRPLAAAMSREETESREEAGASELTLDLFEAISQKKVDVLVVPKGSESCRMKVRNLSKQPLRLRMPETFAGVPRTTYAQWEAGGMGMGGGMMGDMGSGFGSGPGGRGGRGRDGGMGGMGGGQQSFGGGMGGMGDMGGMGGMGGMGMMNIAPERTESIQVQTVCLEHGKAEPRSNGKYRIFPIEAVCANPVVSEICKALSVGTVDQRTAQAAAWHCTDEMSWEELSAKQIIRAFGARYAYFSRSEIQGAMQLVASCEQIVKDRQREEAEEAASASGSESGV